jgi:hypothetical protein
MESFLVTPDAERALQEHIANLPEQQALAVRTISHAWTGGGGSILVGRVAIRLTSTSGNQTYTAATIRSDRAELEIARVLLEGHGVTSEDWLHWSDDLAELRPHGFDPAAKYPTIRYATLSDINLARLVGAVRDLARLASPH